MQTLLNFADPTTARNSLFLSTDGAPFTTSRAIAERFGKKHKNVLQTITNIEKKFFNPNLREVNPNTTNSDFWRLNFQLRDYIGERGKTQLEYKLTHDGFAFLAMRFTGKQAMEWQIAFLTAFNQLEAEAKANRQRYIHALDQVRPALRPVTESFEQGEPRAVVAHRLGKSVNAVTYHRRKARQFGLLSS